VSGKRKSPVEQVRRWRAANPERARQTANETNEATRRARDESRAKWAEIARQAAAEEAAQHPFAWVRDVDFEPTTVDAPDHRVHGLEAPDDQ
jgi:hypothetical protein